MNDDYQKRPELDRDHPYRQFAGIWTQAASRAGASTSTSPQDDIEASVSSGGRFVEQGVRSAYEVIDAYIQQGQKIASELAGMSYSGLPLLENTQELQGRWVQLSSELLANWFDLIGLAFQTVMPGQAGRQNEQESPGSAAREPAPQITWDIRSPRAVRLRADLVPGAGRFALTTEGLRSQSGAASIPAVLETRFNDGSVGIRVEVPADQPDGTYIGTVLNSQTGEIVGEAMLELY